MEDALRRDIGAALGRIPQGLFILTAQFEDRRAGTLVSWVQQAGFTPPMVSIAIAKGRSLLPLVSDSRRFGLCQLSKNDRISLRKFAGGSSDADPFLGLELLKEPGLDVPVLASSMSYLVCEVVCHIDVEGDHDIFIGKVLAGRYLQGEPILHLRDDGFKY